MKYTVTFDNGVRKVDIDHNRPERLPQPGDLYKWTRPACTFGAFEYRPGDKMMVVERTADAPFHRTSSLGNLLVRGPHGMSVWTAFEHCIAAGDLKLVVQE